MNPIHEIEWDDNNNAIACTQSPNELIFTNILEKVLLANYCESQWPLILPHLCELNLWELRVQPLKLPAAAGREKMWMLRMRGLSWWVSQMPGRGSPCNLSHCRVLQRPQSLYLQVKTQMILSLYLPRVPSPLTSYCQNWPSNFFSHNQLTAMINMRVIALIRMGVKAMTGHMQRPR